MPIKRKTKKYEDYTPAFPVGTVVYHTNREDFHVVIPVPDERDYLVEDNATWVLCLGEDFWDPNGEGWPAYNRYLEKVCGHQLILE